VTAPVLIACSHGTRDLAGRAAIRALLDGVRAARPGLDVREAFVDVQSPAVADVVAEALAGGRSRAIVVPVLLSAGYHVHVDIARAVGGFAGRALASPALGPDPRLADLLVTRLAEAGLQAADAVVVAAAGSSDPRATAAVEEVADALRGVHPGPLTVGFGAASAPTVPDAVAAARATGAARVVIAAYLLAPGHFHDRLADAGADVVTAPLAMDDRLVEIVLDRYAAAAVQLA
jgi:sirohydrochlorin ferrochelatase